MFNVYFVQAHTFATHEDCAVLKQTTTVNINNIKVQLEIGLEQLEIGLEL